MSAKFRNLCIALFGLCVVLAVCNLKIGYADLSFADIFFNSGDQETLVKLRFNRMWIVALAGLAIPSSGFILQEYFQNPLAGPEVLGIISVSSLAVAFYIFVSHDWIIPDLLQSGLISLVAFAGGLLLMFVLLLYSKAFTDKTYLIIFGFLISALAGSVVSIMQFYAQNESLKSYILWTFGANNQVNRTQLILVAALTLIGLYLSAKTIKPLMGNALGENYAGVLGINLQRLKLLVILASSLLAAGITAFLGPILFVGIVVPHFCRMLWNPSQLWQQWILNLLFGVALMELFSILSELVHWPLNIISSLFGIPVILTMLLKMNHHAGSSFS